MEQQRNPLAFVDELLEEEKESNEYFGCVDFWKHFEHIDVQHVYNAKSIEFRNLKLIVYEAFFYLVWVIMLTIYIGCCMGDDYMNYEAREQQRRFWGACGVSGCKIDDVVDERSLLQYLEDAKELLGELRSWNWITKKTRAVIVENTVVNPNTNIIVANRLLFEINAYGTVRVVQDHYPMRAALLSLPLLATDERNSFIFLGMFAACFLLYFVSGLWFLYKNGMNYFTYAWNLVDCVNFALVWLYVSYRLETYNIVTEEALFKPEMLGIPELFFSFSKLKDSLRNAEGLLAFIGLCSWIRVLKFFTLLDRFRLLVRVLERTLKDLVVFSVLLFCIIFGFSIAFHVGFYDNEKVPEFQTVTGSMFTLLFMLAKGIRLQFLFESGEVLPQALFWAYLIVIYFLVVNMFMAIVQDTYTLVNFASSNKAKRHFSKDSVIWCFVISYATKLKGEVFYSTTELDEDRGNLNEQFLEVDALPEILKRAWTKKRSQIRELVNQKMETMGNNAEIRHMSAEFADFDKKGVISRVQIQRLLDEDPILVEILGTDKAIDVVRRFTVPEFRNSSAEALDEIMVLQENIFQKLEEYDSRKEDQKLEFSCIDTLKLVATGLHDSLTEIQNQWRNELVYVLEQTNTLTTLLTDMTRTLEGMQTNHSSIVHEAGIQQIVGSGNANTMPTEEK